MTKAATLTQIKPGAQLQDVLSSAQQSINTGDFIQAARLLQDLRKQTTPPVEALYLEAMALIGKGSIDTAEALLNQKAAFFNISEDHKAYGTHAWGRIRMIRGEHRAALPLLLTASKFLIDNQAAHLDLARCFLILNDHVSAEKAFLRALYCTPGDAGTLHNIAACAFNAGRLDDAIAYYTAADSLQQTAESAYHLGNALVMAGKPDAGIKQLDVALRRKPAMLEANLALGNHYLRCRDGARAMAYFKAVDKQLPDQPAVKNALAQCSLLMLEPKKAVQYFQQALKISPTDITSLIDLNVAYQQTGDLNAADKTIQEAIKHYPNNADVRYAQGCLQLMQSNWQDGWRNYEHRWQTSTLGQRYRNTVSPLFSPMWNGKDNLKGKVVMALGEQGAGDLIQFARYCKHLVDLGAVVDLLSPPNMADLFKTLPWIRDVHTHYDHIPAHDYHVSLISCPLFFGTNVATIPAEIPYLSAPQQRQRFSERPTIGLCWGGDPSNPYDASRSMSFHHLLPLIKALGDKYCFVSLQAGERAKTARRAIEKGIIIDGMAHVDSFGDTASVIGCVDRVISVCTATAHLAGAMGKPTSLLLASYHDWRWQVQDGKTAWYPAMQAYIQETLGSWEAVIAHVIKDLEESV